MKINEQYRQQAAVETFSSYLEDEILSAGESAGYCSRDKAAAESVAWFLAPEEGTCFDSKDVALLLSRALWSVGCGSVAQRLLEKQRMDSGLPVAFPGMVEGSAAAFAAWRALVSADAVRSRALAAFENSMILVVDLSRLFLAESGIIELAVFRSLHRLLDVVACFWDSSGGKGVLGLKNLPVTASDCLGLFGRKRAEFVDETMWFCGNRLDLIRSARSWKRSPQVVNLDLRRL